VQPKPPSISFVFCGLRGFADEIASGADIASYVGDLFGLDVITPEASGADLLFQVRGPWYHHS